MAVTISVLRCANGQVINPLIERVFDDVFVARKGHDGLMHWYLDTSGDPMPDQHFKFGLHHYEPVVGDWNKDGEDDIGVFAVQSLAASPTLIGTGSRSGTSSRTFANR